MNKVFLRGNLAANPISKTTVKGILQANFSVAANDSIDFKKTNFIECIAWKQHAKFISDNFKKGTSVTIEGRLSQTSYENKEGKKVFKLQVIVDNIYGNINNRDVHSINESMLDNELNIEYTEN